MRKAINRQTDKRKDTLTDGWRDRQTQAHRKTDKQTVTATNRRKQKMVKL